MKLQRQKHEITLHTRFFSITISRIKQKRLQLQQEGYWQTKHGQLIHVSQMSDKHLINTISFLERKALEEAERKFPNPFKFQEPRGEMANDLFWRNLPQYDLVSKLGKYGVQYRFLQGQPIYDLLLEEGKRRGLNTFHWSVK